MYHGGGVRLQSGGCSARAAQVVQEHGAGRCTRQHQRLVSRHSKSLHCCPAASCRSLVLHRYLQQHPNLQHHPWLQAGCARDAPGIPLTERAKHALVYRKAIAVSASVARSLTLAARMNMLWTHSCASRPRTLVKHVFLALLIISLRACLRHNVRASRSITSGAKTITCSTHSSCCRFHRCTVLGVLPPTAKRVPSFRLSLHSKAVGAGPSDASPAPPAASGTACVATDSDSII